MLSRALWDNFRWRFSEVQGQMKTWQAEDGCHPSEEVAQIRRSRRDPTVAAVIWALRYARCLGVDGYLRRAPV